MFFTLLYLYVFLPAVNYYHKALHLGCCSSPRSASVILVQPLVVEISKCFFKKLVNMAYDEASQMKLNKDELVRVTLVYQGKFNGLYL